MSLIPGIIPPQGFEVVRDAIGAILKTELEAQKVRQTLTENIAVFNARSTPFQHSEKLMINVLCDSADYGSINEKSASGMTNFFIDIYVSAKEKESVDGGYAATVLKDKYLGMIRFILQDHHYMILGLPVGSILGTYVTGWENFEPNNTQDTSFVKMARLTFSVRICEDQTLWAGIEINTIFTKVKLDLTDLGYQYELTTN
jgi:hypothetical protein